jgi:hypothetical protein
LSSEATFYATAFWLVDKPWPKKAGDSIFRALLIFLAVGGFSPASTVLEDLPHKFLEFRALPEFLA